MTARDDNRVVVNDPFARRLMVRYLRHRKDDIGALRSALSDGDFDAIRDKGHNLFGSGSAYGLDRVSELGAALEKTAKKKNGKDIAQLIEKLEAFVSNVRVS
jgi:HPt (histidine-containing phosphotransfer) domain-containing protein